MIESEKSQQIYNDLINGRIINKFILEQQQLVPNPVYTELFTNLEHYAELYRNIGFELVFRDSFFFIRDMDLGNSYKDVAIKVQVILLILARKTTEIGFGYELLENESAGISVEQMDEFNQQEEVQQLIAAAKLGKKTLFEVVRDVLVEKRVMMKNQQERYVLTDSGKYFFTELFDNAMNE